MEELPDIRRNIFSKFQDDMIKRFYPAKGGKSIAPVIGKSYDQVRKRAQQLGVRFDVKKS